MPMHWRGTADAAHGCVGGSGDATWRPGGSKKGSATFGPRCEMPVCSQGLAYARITRCSLCAASYVAVPSGVNDVQGAADRDLALSVVVMGYRNRDTIVRAVRSVVDQASPGPFEVVVVTSGGDDSAEEVRRSFPALCVVESSVRLLPGAARNAGVAATRGRTVAFLAADCVAEPGWIAARLAAHDVGHPAVACAVTNGERRRPSAWAFHFELYAERLPGRPPGPVDAPDAACHGLSLDRSLLERLGPFDEQVEIGEDTKAALRLAAMGVPVWFEPTVRTAHFGPRDTVSMLRARYRQGRQLAALDCSTARPALPLLRRWTRRVHRTVAFAWRHAGRDRPWVILAVPWIMAGRAAGLAGWYRARSRIVPGTRRANS